MEVILKYLIDNKEWIFSGLGIFIIGGIISLIKFIINRNKKASKKTMKQINNDNSSGTQIGIQNNYYQTGDKKWPVKLLKWNKKTNLDHKVRKSLYKTITMEWTTKTPNH